MMIIDFEKFGISSKVPSTKPSSCLLSILDEPIMTIPENAIRGQGTGQAGYKAHPHCFVVIAHICVGRNDPEYALPDEAG